MNIHTSILVSCHIQDSPQAIPLAASLLKSYWGNKEGLTISLKNYYSGKDPLTAAKEILKDNPDSVGCSMYIWNRTFFEQLVTNLKKLKQDLIIYAGGAEVTASWKSLNANDNFNFLIRGEGEIPFSNLMKFMIEKTTLQPDKILPQDHIQNLNEIPSPFLTGIIDPKDWDGLLWELSRGCPFNCSFCSESRGISGVRYFDEKRIAEELQFFEKNTVDQIFVLDPTFNITTERALKIISLIKEHAPFIHYTFEVRAELLNDELAQAFSEIHCSLQIGLQSAHHDVLLKLNRNIDQDDFSQKIDLLNQYGAVFGLDLIFGLPGDTLEGFLQSLDYALFRIPNHLDIFRLSVFPGTELYDRASELELVFMDSPPYQVLHTPGFEEMDLMQAENISRAVDLFYNKGRSAPWLLSLTEFLEQRPSDFFKEFSRFIQRNNYSEKEIFHTQIDFLQELFRGKNHDGLACAVDLALFHHLYGEALHAEPLLRDEKNSKVFQYTADTVFRLNTTLKQGIFSFDVTLYSEMGMIDIDLFLQQYTKTVSYGLIFNNGFEILTMSVEQYLYQFTTAINGEKSLSEILKLINTKAEEMEDFIDFLIESELIIPVE